MMHCIMTCSQADNRSIENILLLKEKLKDRKTEER